MHTYTVTTRCTTCGNDFQLTQVHNKPMSAYARCPHEKVGLNRKGQTIRVVCNAENLVVTRRFRWSWQTQG